MKPNHFLQRRTRCISFGEALHELLDRDRKISRDNFGKKGKSIGFVYCIHFKLLHKSKFCGDLIDNRADALICVLKDKDIETKKK